MPTLTIRNVPVSVVDSLKSRAKQNGRSMEQEVRELLAGSVSGRQALLDEIERSRAKQSRPITPEEIESWIAEGRE